MTNARRRLLVVLGSTALVFGLLATWSVWQRAAQGAARHTPALVLPGFTERAVNAARIEIKGPGGDFAVIRRSPTGWVLDRGEFPADYDEVRRTLISLAQLTTIAPKTSRPDWLRHLHLDRPGSGTEVTVKNAEGTVLAQLVTGIVEELGDPSGAKGLFVRRPGEAQAWLARAVFPVRGDIASWMTREISGIGPARLQSVSVQPMNGQGFTVSRSSPTEAVSLVGAPANATPDFELINQIGFAIATFTPTDIRVADGMDFSKASRATATSFDGLSITFLIMRQADGVWAKLSATSRQPATTQQAADINARAGAFAFKLPEEKAAPLLVDRQRVLTAPARAIEGVMPPGGGAMP